MTSARLLRGLLGGAVVASLPLWLASTAACSDDSTGANGGTSGTGGANASSGAAAVSAGAGGGGSSNAGSGNQGGLPGGGSAGRAGSAAGGSLAQSGAGGTGTGAVVEPGQPCTANCPTGTVQTCFDSCPLGACDDGGFFADPTCSSLYPAPISSETVFCAKGQTATYCLTVLDKNQYFYVVSCEAGTPTVTKCNGGCGVANSTHAASCNQ